MHRTDTPRWFREPLGAVHAACIGVLAIGCSSGPVSVGDNRGEVSESDAGSNAEAGADQDGALSDGSEVADAAEDREIEAGPPLSDAEPDAGEAGIGEAGPDASATPQQLLNLLEEDRCSDQLSSGAFKSHESSPTADVRVCRLGSAVYWRSGMEIACDGRRSNVCNEETDRFFRGITVGRDSDGNPLNAAEVPYVVVPDLMSPIFSYRSAGLHMGSVVAVIYMDQVRFGVVGDEGDNAVLGQGSYAMAASFPGVNPDPRQGGVYTGVTYIAFSGHRYEIDALEDTARAKQLAQQAVDELIRTGGR